ncbi:MAG: hypothetical protein LBN42_04005, partial [Oscillospiraceae bacterium]|nr:hypothetical protein [Oscillospiraceae bacterium]
MNSQESTPINNNPINPLIGIQAKAAKKIGFTGKAVNYVMFRAKKNFAMSLALGIMCLLSYPLAMIALSVYAGAWKFDIMHADEISNGDFTSATDDSFGFVLICILVACCCMLGVVLITYMNAAGGYRYHTAKEDVDGYYSLPLTRKQLFFADFFAGLSPVIIGYVLSSGIGLAIYYGVVQPIIKSVPDSALIDEGNTGIFMENTLFNFDTFKLIVGAMGTGLIFLIFTFVFGSFITSLSARVHDSVILPVVFQTAFTAGVAIIYSIATINSGSFEDDSTGIKILLYVLILLTPIGFLTGSEVLPMLNIENLYGLYGGRFSVADIAKELPIFRLELIIPLISVMICYVILAYFLTEQRLAERTGERGGFRYVYHTVITMATFDIVGFYYVIMGGNPFSADGGVFGGMILTTAIVYLLYELVAMKNFKKLH